MPKIKTHSWAKKRFHKSSTGKLLRTKGMKSHLRRKKTKRNKRLFASKVGLSDAIGRKIKRLI